MTKSDLEVWKDFKRLNKVARLKRAQKYGFATVELYAAQLEANATNFVKKPNTKAKIEIPVIHIVDILDASTSMSGGKFIGALKGINSSIKELKKETEIEYKYTLCVFSGYQSILFPYSNVNLKKINEIKAKLGSITALYDAIGETIKSLASFIKLGEKVLINIYTDGGENDSKIFNKSDISNLISIYSELGFTVTFIGTISDTKHVIRELSIKESNTLSYDGSAKGLEKSMSINSLSRTAYSSSVKKGEDVSTGFYKNIN